MVQRRTVLIAGLASTVAGLPLAWATAPSSFELADFVQLSAKLTGRTPSSLNNKAANALFAALSTLPSARQLPELAQLPANEAADTPLGRELLAAWYTGVVQLPTGPQRVAGAAPLAWSAAHFLHAPATCGGATGAWALPPQA